jgi:hypothetical protein
MSNAADQTFLNSFCVLRKSKALNNIPTPPRTELQPSPYEQGFTQNQLNMRRKYEILQYHPNAQSTQTNKLTKKQQYAQAVSGNSPYKKYIPPSDDIVCPVPTTSSDIPGPSIVLYLDDTVPLYNYVPVKDPQAQTTNPIQSDYIFGGNDV